MSSLEEKALATRGSMEIALTTKELTAVVNKVKHVIKEVMVKDVHFGTIPGTPKPTLYQSGAQLLALTFHFDNQITILDKTRNEDEVRYVVQTDIYHQGSGIRLGSGVGACSSNEEKYMWRKPVCDLEWDEFPPDLKRQVWKKGFKDHKTGQMKPAYKLKQIRTNPADVENTILKMASKRSLIAAIITCTGSSDILTQDLEDLPPEYIDEDEGGQAGPGKEESVRPGKKAESKPTEGKPAGEKTSGPPPADSGDKKASEAQVKMLHAKAIAAKVPDQVLRDMFMDNGAPYDNTTETVLEHQMPWQGVNKIVTAIKDYEEAEKKRLGAGKAGYEPDIPFD